MRPLRNLRFKGLLEILKNKRIQSVSGEIPYLAMKSSINQLFFLVDQRLENGVEVGAVFYEVNFSAEQLFQGVFQIKVIAYIVEFIMVDWFKVNEEVYVASVIESICQDRAKNRKSLDPVLTAQV